MSLKISTIDLKSEIIEMILKNLIIIASLLINLAVKIFANFAAIIDC
nr:MAG TPA: hypothetical protein [Caudoviricetes sp.]